MMHGQSTSLRQKCRLCQSCAIARLWLWVAMQDLAVVGLHGASVRKEFLKFVDICLLLSEMCVFLFAPFAESVFSVTSVLILQHLDSFRSVLVSYLRMEQL